MHGELIEFNERLHRALVAKEALVSQMRQELIDLRGPVSAPHPTRQVLALPSASARPHCGHQASVTQSYCCFSSFLMVSVMQESAGME